MLQFRDEVKQVLYNAISNSLGIEESELNDNMQLISDLKAKSVNFVHLVSALEDAFEMEVQFMKLRRQKTVADMIDFIVELRGV